jgi:DNA-binding LacI/PurR family transcriptional regulator
LEIGREVSPPLTTVEAFYPDIGSCSADYLLGALAGKKIRKRIKLKTELLVRESSGPAPSTR